MHSYFLQGFFCVIKTHIVDMIDFDLIKIRFNIFVCSILSTYFLVFFQEDFINYTVNNSIILLIPIKFISWCGIVTAVLSRPTFIILGTNFSQDLSFI